MYLILLILFFPIFSLGIIWRKRSLVKHIILYFMVKFLYTNFYFSWILIFGTWVKNLTPFFQEFIQLCINHILNNLFSPVNSYSSINNSVKNWHDWNGFKMELERPLHRPPSPPFVWNGPEPLDWASMWEVSRRGNLQVVGFLEVEPAVNSCIHQSSLVC